MTGPETLGLIIYVLFLLCALVILGLSLLRFVPYVKDHLPAYLPRFTQEWEASWKDYTIIVRHWANLLATDGEDVLSIDGVPVSKTDAEPKESEDLYGEIRHGGEVHVVHTHLGRIVEYPRIGCVIMDDDVLIGGDVDKNLLT